MFETADKWNNLFLYRYHSIIEQKVKNQWERQLSVEDTWLQVPLGPAQYWQKKLDWNIKLLYNYMHVHQEMRPYQNAKLKTLHPGHLFIDNLTAISINICKFKSKNFNRHACSMRDTSRKSAWPPEEKRTRISSACRMRQLKETGGRKSTRP